MWTSLLTLWLRLDLGKFEGKKDREKVEDKKKLMKIKIDLKSIHYFYMIFQNFMYFDSSI